MTKPPQIKSVSQMRALLVPLFRKHLGSRWRSDQDYYLYELWSMNQPPDVLENTDMADRLDRIMGFHLSEEELMIAYDEPLSVSSVYLFNLYLKTMSDEVEEEKPVQKKTKPKKKTK